MTRPSQQAAGSSSTCLRSRLRPPRGPAAPGPCPSPCHSWTFCCPPSPSHPKASLLCAVWCQLPCPCLRFPAHRVSSAGRPPGPWWQGTVCRSCGGRGVLTGQSRPGSGSEPLAAPSSVPERWFPVSLKAQLPPSGAGPGVTLRFLGDRSNRPFPSAGLSRMWPLGCVWP